MKTFIIFFVVALAASTLAEIVLDADFKQVSENCIKSSGVDEDLVARGRKNDFVEDEKLMNYYSCVFEKRGMQNADGTFNPEVMIEKLPENFNKEKATKVIEKCIKTDATTPAKAAYDAVKCFISTMATKA